MNRLLIGGGGQLSKGRFVEKKYTLTDWEGKVLWVIRGEYTKGYHEITEGGQHLTKGVIQYTLTSGEFSVMRRMVITN